jgi:hypothetical protein
MTISQGDARWPSGFIYFDNLSNPQIVLDSARNVWAKSSVGAGGWTKEVTGGQTAIAAGGNGLQMILDTAGNVWAKSSVGAGGWTKEVTGGQTAIAAG